MLDNEELFGACASLYQSRIADTIALDVPAPRFEPREEALVVAHEEQATRAVGECAFQTFDRRQIQVVGRLVHCDQMRLAHHAEREQELADLAGAGRATLEQAVRPRSEPADHVHRMAQLFGAERAHLCVDLRAECRVDFLRHCDELVGGHVHVRQDVADERRLATPVPNRRSSVPSSALPCVRYRRRPGILTR